MITTILTISDLQIGQAFYFIYTGTGVCIYQGEGQYGSIYTMPGFQLGDDYAMGANSDEPVELA